MPEKCDGIVTDAGGYGFTLGITHEMMGGGDVRILIGADARFTVVRKTFRRVVTAFGAAGKLPPGYTLKRALQFEVAA
jgi:hypothetical protein